MKTLFVCRANVGRSQAASSFYNQLVPDGSDSAGTIVYEPGEELCMREGAANIISVMKTYGIDMSHNTRAQLTEEMAEKYDKIIVLAEPESIPEWLTNNPRAEFWTVEDTKGKDLRETNNIVIGIKNKVEALARQSTE